MKNIITSLVLACLALVCLPVQAQKSSQESSAQDYVVRCVAFYNLENLFDTIHDYYLLENGDTIHKNDYEYLPSGGMHWSGLKYRNKLKNMAYAISQFGLDKTPLGASIVGVCEVENIRCLQDLCKEIENQTGRKYIPILLEGPDRRGVDVGYLYDPRYFVPAGKPVPYTLKAHYSDGGVVRSRFQLLLSGSTTSFFTLPVVSMRWRATTLPSL